MNPPTGDLRQDTVFVGRSDELYQLVKNLERGRHSLIVGEKGIGKSRLMTEARWILSGRKRRIDFSGSILTRYHGRLLRRIDPGCYKILSIEHTSPFSDCLKEMAEGLFYLGDLVLETVEEEGDWRAFEKSLRGTGRIRLQAAILEGISRSGKPYLIFFDSLDRLSVSYLGFVEALLTVAVVCTAVVQIRENCFFRRIWASFAKIELGPLPRPVCVRLMDYFFRNYRFRLADTEFYSTEILKAANGNPFHIRNMLWHGSREKYIDAEEIRKLQRIDEGQYFNMGPLYIFGIAMFTLFKIFSIGTGNREFYIYFSALGFLAYLVFRVFRAFFLFRPQRYR